MTFPEAYLQSAVHIEYDHMDALASQHQNCCLPLIQSSTLYGKFSLPQ